MAEFYQDNNREVDFKKFLPIIIIIGLIVLLVVSWNSITVKVGAGHAGVIYRQFSGGLDRETTYGEGLHFIAPWNTMFVYDIRQQEKEETMDVLSSNGLDIKVDVSVWYHPKYDELGDLHGEVGDNYAVQVVIPSIRSAARSVIGRYTPEEIYSTKRDSIQAGIFENTTEIVSDKHVMIERVLIRSITLPPKIKEAIERKLSQEQQSLEYEFKLEKAKKEAERQRIEAEGKAKANEIISASLTDKILREKGIEATIKLSESQNAKVVVIGSGDEGLPLILGNN